jgi:hypothetical protein
MRQSASPSLTHVLYSAVFTAVALRAFLLPVSPNDSWWHLATGRMIVEGGAIPTSDVFSYTYPGTPWFDQPWLAQVVLYRLHGLGGVPLMVFFAFLLLAVTFALLLRLCGRITGDAKLAAALLIVTLPASSPNWSLRSQIFAIPLFVAFLVILAEWRAGRNRQGLWLLPVLMAVWVNVHGSFVLGGMLLGLVALGSALERYRARREGRPVAIPPLRHLLLWGVVTALATLLNPRGHEVIGYVAGLLGDPAVQGLIQEWQAPHPASFVGAAFLCYAAVTVLTVLLSRRRSDATEILTFAVFLAMALGAERHVAWFALVTTPMFVGAAAEIPWIRSSCARVETPAALNRSLIASFGVLVLAASPWLKPQLPWPSGVRSLLSADTPVAALAALQRDPDPPSRLFHSEAFGSYLMWAAPERQVFVDTRVELYPLEHWQRYGETSQGRGARETFELHSVDGLLLDTRRQAGLVGWALRSPDWSLRYRDRRSAYLVRAEGRPDGGP